MFSAPDVEWRRAYLVALRRGNNPDDDDATGGTNAKFYPKSGAELINDIIVP
ncbi:hypothetical protein [Streptomyces sp. MUM 178J]|uniref:hypothetical protein n=1 Tax=Streptomyces sp. MUM 178J TaxID=2791991 RepID=UPI001F0374B4|nr:hypothetical protein [Streptomyces sp. MUM 178J]WRQ81804.1 hypothetical protein I3F59_021945 [Streptomyces sp. MUM 178J]